MSWYGTLVRSFIAPLWALKERSPYLSHLRSAEERHRWPIERVKADQQQRLYSLLCHAFENTIFYRNGFNEIGVVNSEICRTLDIQQLPLLTKQDLRTHKMQMLANCVPSKKLQQRKTSGSTGVSVELCVDEDSAQWKRGVTMSYDRWAGWDLGERVGSIWGNPEIYKNWRLYVRNLILGRHMYLDTLKMDEHSMHAFHYRLVRNPPSILFGHAHSLFLFARFMEENGLSGIYPKGIISTCMVLHDFERQTIERVFGCRVTNRYGCEEVSLIACECSEGNMHLNCDSLIVEFIRDGKPVPPGEPGAIVVTDLTNYAMPMIRYQVGDVGVPSAKTDCPCGCSYPMMERLEGRVADYVATPSGTYVSGISLTENFAMHLPGVKQMQIVQKKVDFLIFRIVKGESFSSQTLACIERLTRERFGDQMRYEIEFFESIQSESSGKYRFCVSEIPNPFS